MNIFEVFSILPPCPVTCAAASHDESIVESAPDVQEKAGMVILHQMHQKHGQSCEQESSLKFF